MGKGVDGGGGALGETEGFVGVEVSVRRTLLVETVRRRRQTRAQRVGGRPFDEGGGVRQRRAGRVLGRDIGVVVTVAVGVALVGESLPRARRRGRLAGRHLGGQLGVAVEGSRSLVLMLLRVPHGRPRTAGEGAL